MTSSYEATLHQLCQADERMLVMTAENRAAIRGLPALLGDRFIDVGIAEQTMIGMAAGLASRGRTPVTHALASFLVFRAYEFIRDDVGIPRLPVKLVGGVPGFLSSANGPTHQATEDIALMRGIPGMEVWCPADRFELAEGMRVLFSRRTAPTYVRYNDAPPVVEHRQPFEAGKAEVLSEGTDVALLTYGFLLEQAWDAKRRLEAAGRSVRLVNMRMLEPLDEDAILASLESAKLLVTVEDHFLRGGLYGAVCELLVRAQRMAKVVPIALEQRWFVPALLPDVLRAEGFTGEAIAGRILERL